MLRHKFGLTSYEELPLALVNIVDIVVHITIFFSYDITNQYLPSLPSLNFCCCKVANYRVYSKGVALCSRVEVSHLSGEQYTLWLVCNTENWNGFKITHKAHCLTMVMTTPNNQIITHWRVGVCTHAHTYALMHMHTHTQTFYLSIKSISVDFLLEYIGIYTWLIFENLWNPPRSIPDPVSPYDV